MEAHLLQSNDTVPLETFIENVHTIGLANVPDVAALLARLPNARGPEIAGILMQILMYVPSGTDESDQPAYSDYERY
jgi:hypothetical protein